MRAFITAVAAAALLAACATKNYGRQGEVTDFERKSMTCREIDLEMAKVNGFLRRVDDESGFDMRSVLSFLGDFGVGNLMERNAAVNSATRRLEQLQDARQERGCSAAADVVPSQAAASGVAISGPAASPAVAASTVRPKPPVLGAESHQVERMAEVKVCNPSATAQLTNKGPGFELYSVACTNGDSLMVRCETGACRVLK